MDDCHGSVEDNQCLAVEAITTAARARMEQAAAGLRPMMKGQTGVRTGRGGRN
jgi:hypothetical protein